MTRFDPTLIVKRVVVERSDRVAYDEPYHAGVNVIRGENSSGKSTILNLIMYGLGGDLTDWSDAAKLCTRVLIEVDINGSVATLSRDISTERGRPMEIFGGDFDTSRRVPRDEWTRYPYSRSPSKESFSQALFRLLGIPEVASEVSGNLTIHQILRLLYADQLSPVESLFKSDKVYDSPMIRDAVGRLLCGAYDGLLYQNQLQIRDLQREFDTVSGELRSLFSVASQGKDALTLDWIAAQRAVLEGQRLALQAGIEEAERRLFTTDGADELTLKAQEEAYAEVQRLQVVLGAARQERDNLTLNIADSAAFITSLENKLKALGESAAVAEHFGEVRFQYCPACYAPLDASDASAQTCHLCKSPFDKERSQGRIVSIINDTAIQLKQSKMLQARREEDRAKLDAGVQTAEDQWRRMSRRLAELQRLPSSDVRDHLRDLQRKAGYLEREIENLEDRARMVEMIDQMSRRKAELNERITYLQTQNEGLLATQQDRVSRAYGAIADEIRALLRNDLRREISFENPSSIDFDFAANKISVDGETYFSASSRVILKSSFFLGFLAAAMKNEFFRHPRFIMIDTVEDKGMEVQRSHNFQMQIARISSESKVDHQIIYATSMIAPDLDDLEFTIGKFSTRDDYTLDIR
jgi:hypothetical protein